MLGNTLVHSCPHAKTGMTQELFTHVSERKHPRYIFKRRGTMRADADTMEIHTVDVSAQGFGILASRPLHIGRNCDILLPAVLGDGIVHLEFSCTTMYCILAGIHGFRIGLFVDDNVDIHKQQLKRILTTCSSRII